MYLRDKNMSRVISIGNDLHQMSRFLNILKRNGSLESYKTKRFSERILNPTFELPKFKKFLENNNIEECAKILSISWSIKESIYKTLDDKDQHEFIMKDWYKTNDERGRPIIGNHNYMSVKRDESFLCSISHDGGFVNTFVLRQSNI